MFKNKKAILGLDTVKEVTLALLVLAVLCVAVIIALNAITDLDGVTTSTTVVTNLATDPMNTTGYQIPGTVGYKNCEFSLTHALNSSGGDCSNSGNYTITGCFINASTASGGCLNFTWTINGTYTDAEDLDLIEGNVSQGITSFFGNIPTFFTLLAVVVIILIISIVVVAVGRFGDGAGTQGVSPREPGL